MYFPEAQVSSSVPIKRPWTFLEDGVAGVALGRER